MFVFLEISEKAPKNQRKILFLKTFWWNGVTPMEQHPCKILAQNSKIWVPNSPKNPQNHMFAE
jgi:hypothetical protein